MADEENKIYDAELIDADNENFDGVFEMVKYEDSEISTGDDDAFVVAEYNDIKTTEITINQKKVAKRFVQQAEKLIKSYCADNNVSEELGKYLKSIATLQVEQLGDMLSLVVINKQMLENLVARINAVRGEDYALVQTYTSLLQQHIKLNKEFQSLYTNIPMLMKKMTTDISDEALVPETPNNPVITEAYGKNQFNNSKEMLKNLKKKIENKKLEKNQ